MLTFQYFAAHPLYSQSCLAGAFTYGTPNVAIFEPHTKLVIGKYCSIAAGATFLLGGEHNTDWVTTYPFGHHPAWLSLPPVPGHPKTKGHIIVGNDVWIGTEATILSGVVIGDGAVIGAHALVSKSVPPYSIVVGNPARVVKQRFDDTTIQRLLALKWWDWDVARIHLNIPLLCSNRIQEFLTANGA
jgi:acetyltransferase-like isoleucine patch superfamily enzyme